MSQANALNSSKLNAYVVLAPPTSVSKINAYVVLAQYTGVSKLNAYAVLGPYVAPPGGGGKPISLLLNF